MRKEAVARYGVPFMQALNTLRLNDINTVKARVGGLIAEANSTREQRFQQGGLAVGGESMGTINVNMTFPGSSAPVPLKIGPEHLRQFIREVNKMNWRSSGTRLV